MKQTYQKQDQYKIFERHGQLVFALNSEIIIPHNAPVRLLSAQLEELEYGKLYKAYSPRGRKSAADPRVLFKVMVHGYLCGIYSSRKLEEACQYRIDFRWLLEDQKAPDHTTFARFRTGRCREVVEDLFYQFVKKLEDMGEADHQTVYIDGTKLESAAGRYTFVWRKPIQKHLAKVKAELEKRTGLKSASAIGSKLEEERQHILSYTEAANAKVRSSVNGKNNGHCWNAGKHTNRSWPSWAKAATAIPKQIRMPPSWG